MTKFLKIAVLSFAVLMASCAAPSPVLAATTSVSSTAFPNGLPPVTAPGFLNPAVTQANIKSTICVSGYTAKIRPSVSFTNKLKLKQMADLHLTGKASDYEEDHLISLELGGSPTSPLNLWPQAWSSSYNAHAKDQLENKLNKLVCSGTITLDFAQKAISKDWIAAYKVYVSAKPK